MAAAQPHPPNGSQRDRRLIAMVMIRPRAVRRRRSRCAFPGCDSGSGRSPVAIMVGATAHSRVQHLRRRSPPASNALEHPVRPPLAQPSILVSTLAVRCGSPQITTAASCRWEREADCYAGTARATSLDLPHRAKVGRRPASAMRSRLGSRRATTDAVNLSTILLGTALERRRLGGGASGSRCHCPRRPGRPPVAVPSRPQVDDQRTTESARFFETFHTSFSVRSPTFIHPEATAARDQLRSSAARQDPSSQGVNVRKRPDLAHAGCVRAIPPQQHLESLLPSPVTMLRRQADTWLFVSLGDSC
jgi:hypothetical protein